MVFRGLGARAVAAAGSTAIALHRQHAIFNDNVAKGSTSFELGSPLGLAALAESLAKPIAPALVCVMALTVCFFGLFLLVILVRIGRLLASAVVQRQIHLPCTEAALHQATEALALTPMLSILLVSARLRTLQADPDKAASPIWTQVGMYVGTGSLFLRVLLAALLGALSSSPQAKPGVSTKQVFTVVLFMLSLVIFACSGVILWYTLTLEGALAPMSPMMICVAILISCFLLENIVLEVNGVLSGVGMSCISQRPRQEEMVDKEGAIVESMNMQFPLMLCVLLVGMDMRAVQMNLKPESWAMITMYSTTGAFILQVACSTFTSMLARMREESWGTSATWPNLRDQAQSAPLAPGGPDAGAGGAGIQMEKPISTCLWLGWTLIMVCLYLGTALILVSVFMMERDPLDVVVPKATLNFFRPQDSNLAQFRDAPPISPAMKCVMMLVLTYFSTHFCLYFVCPRQWAMAVLSGIQHSLAFAPMLCVMMIAVRLRAMFLKLQDPQLWAQVTMYTATFAVIVQVICSAVPQSSEEWETSGWRNPLESSTVGKVGFIFLLIFRYLACMTLYIAVAMLIIALLLMESK